eukprot:1932450-Rhodomonas_salina.2
MPVLSTAHPSSSSTPPSTTRLVGSSARFFAQYRSVLFRSTAHHASSTLSQYRASQYRTLQSKRVGRYITYAVPVPGIA